VKATGRPLGFLSARRPRVDPPVTGARSRTAGLCTSARLRLRALRSCAPRKGGCRGGRPGRAHEDVDVVEVAAPSRPRGHAPPPARRSPTTARTLRQGPGRRRTDRRGRRTIRSARSGRRPPAILRSPVLRRGRARPRHPRAAPWPRTSPRRAGGRGRRRGSPPAECGAAAPEPRSRRSRRAPRVLRSPATRYETRWDQDGRKAACANERSFGLGARRQQAVGVHDARAGPPACFQDGQPLSFSASSVLYCGRRRLGTMSARTLMIGRPGRRVRAGRRGRAACGSRHQGVPPRRFPGQRLGYARPNSPGSRDATVARLLDRERVSGVLPRVRSATGGHSGSR
jgi:hypothetical protein